MVCLQLQLVLTIPAGLLVFGDFLLDNHSVLVDAFQTCLVSPGVFMSVNMLLLPPKAKCTVRFLAGE